MEGSTRSLSPNLPLHIRLQILSLLPPNEIALSGRLACKDAAQHFSQPPQRTACPSQPLPGHAATAPWCVEGAQAALRELPFVRKLLLLSRAAGSGCQTNVDFALQLLERVHVLPPWLQQDHYSQALCREHRALAGTLSGRSFWVMFQRYAMMDVGSAAVAAGAADLLPFLEQRCPGLLDPGRTLQAAAERFDLVGLQAAWRLLVQRMRDSTKPPYEKEANDETYDGIWNERMRSALLWVLAAAARSTTPDALAKMDWVAVASRILDDGYSLQHEEALAVCKAAVSSGDAARLQWLTVHGFTWHTSAVAQAVLEHADLAFIQRMDTARCYLPPPESEAWKDAKCAYKAAMSRKDSVAKLRWLADRGATLEQQQSVEPIQAAAYFGNLEAVRFLLQQRRARNAPGPDQGGYDASLLAHALGLAVRSGSIPLASWLRQQGATLQDRFFMTAARMGSVPMVQWLLEAGCPRGAVTLGDVAGVWPIGCSADGQQLLEAVRLLMAAGWPTGGEEEEGDEHPLVQAAYGGQPYSVWQALQEQLPAGAREAPWEAAFAAAAAGCVATLEALAEQGVLEGVGAEEAAAMYAIAAANGDMGTLSCLLRLDVSMGGGAVSAATWEWGPLARLKWETGQRTQMGSEEFLRSLERNSVYIPEPQWP